MRFKRVLPLLLSFALIGGAFAGCGGSDNKDDGADQNAEEVNPPAGGDENPTPEPNPNPNPNPNPEPDPEPNPNPEPEPNPNPDPDPEPEPNPNPDPDPEPEKPKSTPLASTNNIYIVGDSTVCAFTDNQYLPRYGYGTQIHEYINVQESQVKNLAISGKSSLDFLGTSNYTTLTNGLKSGDYLIIGFGHNDEKDDDSTRYTNPTKSYTDDSVSGGPSFQYTLYENYVKLAKEKGATPILCTPIVRYSSSGAYTGAKVHVTDKGDYVAAIKSLGAATDTTVIDLTTITKDLYSADNDAAQYFHAHGSFKEESIKADATTKLVPYTGNETPTGRDDTHINKYGAKMVAYQFANALKGTESSLKAHVRDDITAPTKAVDYLDAIKKDWVKPDYSSPVLTDSIKLAGTDGWYKTLMGNCGGKKQSEFQVSYNNGTYTIANVPTGTNSGSNGKIEGAGDGFYAIFKQLDKRQNFKITATVNLTAVCTNKPSQAAFGLMLRDDMWLDTATGFDGKTAVTANYLTAGALGDGSALFGRKDGAIVKTGNSVSIGTDKTYTLEIERVGQSMVAKISDGTHTYTSGDKYLDLNLFAVDSDYIYLCMFANRDMGVEFKNVVYTDLGLANELA